MSATTVNSDELRGPVTVIIPVLNGAAMIADTLRALLAQADASPGLEVLVVDNGSTDGTQEIVQQFPVRLLHEPRRGPSAARNLGLHEARGALIACLDADTLPTRRWLREITDPFKDPAVILTAGAILTYQPQTVAERYCDASGIYHPRHNAQAKVFPFAVGMNMAVRREAATGIGGWEEAFRWGEDIDFSHRILQRHPGSLTYCPRAIIFHRNRATTAALTRQAQGYGKGAALIYRRYPEVATWGVWRTLIVLAVLLGRWASAGFLWCGRILRLVQPGRAALQLCHAMWCWSFWRGFFMEYYSGHKAGENAARG